MTLGLAFVVLLAAIPFLLFLVNLPLFRRAPRPVAPRVTVSVLIPARNEEASIGDCVRSVLASTNVELEVLVLDDGSEDATFRIVSAIQSMDRRVRVLRGSGLPSGWCGKQHACFQLSQQATHDLLCFVDADVRLSPDCLSRMAGFLRESGAALVSGFPGQQTGTVLEQLLLPLIHFILLGFLPLRRMRSSTDPAFAAGCGQLIMAEREAYTAAGGHFAVRSSLHDGITLPRALRLAGFKTDIFDATDTAVCRMYQGAREVWHGLAKNAVEGIAAPSRIAVFTILLFGGQVLPWLMLAGALVEQASTAKTWVLLGTALSGIMVRLTSARRFRQPILSAFLHPIGLTVLLSLQWYALGLFLLRRPAVWKGRAYAGLTD